MTEREPDRGRLVVDADERLTEQLHALSRQRMVFFAGLPGTGKSLLVHQLVHLATASGRTVHLLQWDVARPVFEATVAGRRYPLLEGVTHPVIRKAAGLWARRALVLWSESHRDPRHLLAGETPFVGSRLVELARRRDDGAEALLSAKSCRFVIAVPSSEVRRFLEAQRERRTASPLHPREREDAPPSVLHDLWRELAEVAGQLGLASGSAGVNATSTVVPYDPIVYRRVYELVLRHRHVEVAALDAILPTESLSVYDFAVSPEDLVPTENEAEEAIREVERDYPDLTRLKAEIASWWEV